MSAELLGETANAWLALGSAQPNGSLRLVLADVDGVVTRGEGQPVELDVLARLAAINAAARADPCVPAITLCTGRQAPYVELMAQLTNVFLPCIFEHGAGLFFPNAFKYQFDPRLGSDYSARLARLRAAFEDSLLRPGRAFVQPGKEASLTLYPLGDTPLDEIESLAESAVAQASLGFDVARNVRGVELRPRGIDKGTAAEHIAELLGLSLAAMAGIGDSDPDLSFLQRIGIGFSAAPANATPGVLQAVDYRARGEFGTGLLEVLAVVEAHNRRQA